MEKDIKNEYVIVFSDGHEVEVTKGLVKALQERLGKSCGNFQMFTAEGDDLPSLIINLSQVSHIKKKVEISYNADLPF